MAIVIRNLIGDHFCEDAHGRDGHGHASKSKEILSKELVLFYICCFISSRFYFMCLFMVMIYLIATCFHLHKCSGASLVLSTPLVLRLLLKLRFLAFFDLINVCLQLNIKSFRKMYRTILANTIIGMYLSTKRYMKVSVCDDS
jgi:hypothetical protein